MIRTRIFSCRRVDLAFFGIFLSLLLTFPYGLSAQSSSESEGSSGSAESSGSEAAVNCSDITTCVAQLGSLRTESGACCGDGILTAPPEQCDGAAEIAVKPASVLQEAWDAKTCIAVGLPNQCNFQYPDLNKCGDGIIQTARGEQCDGAVDTAAITTPPAPVGFPSAKFNEVTCSPPIQTDPSAGCKFVFPVWCGDGAKNAGEQCDFAAATGSPGYHPQCTATCTIPDPCFGVAPPDTHGRAGCPRAGWATTNVICAVGLPDWSGGWRDAFAFKFVYSSDYGTQVSYGTDGSACHSCVCARARGSGCFDPETKLSVKDRGEVEAREIKAGDLLLNPKTQQYSKVENIIEGPEKELYLLTFNVDGVERSTKLSAEHVLVTERGYVRTKDIVGSDKLLLENGKFIPLGSIAKVPASKVVNFIVNSDSNVPDQHLIVSDGIVTGDLWLQNNLDKK